MKTLTTIRRCRSCDSPLIEPFFNLGEQPLANSLLRNAADAEPSYRLSLSFCRHCALVQLNETIDPKRLFRTYPWVTRTSRAARDFANTFAETATKRVKKKLRFVVEIGSNDGTFLLPFLKRNVKVLGVDPAENIAAIANESGIPTIAEFFGNDVGRRIRSEHGPAEIVIARNVLYHLADLHGVLEGITATLSDQGILAAEFHYAGTMLKELHYDTIYHEHLCYYTLKSFETLLNYFGLYGFDINWSPINAGGLIVYARKAKQSPTSRFTKLLLKEKREGANRLKNWRAFRTRSEMHRVGFRSAIEKLAQGGGRIVGYGASARSATLLNYCGINQKRIAAIADGNPFKQGMFTAGSRIPILAPDEVFQTLPSAVVLLAWNFRKEIMAILRRRYRFRGPVVLPFPKKTRILTKAAL